MDVKWVYIGRCSRRVEWVKRACVSIITNGKRSVGVGLWQAYAAGCLGVLLSATMAGNGSMTKQETVYGMLSIAGMGGCTKTRGTSHTQKNKYYKCPPE